MKYIDRIAALIMVTGLTLALCLGIDSEAKTLLAVAGTYLFTKQVINSKV